MPVLGDGDGGNVARRGVFPDQRQFRIVPGKGEVFSAVHKDDIARVIPDFALGVDVHIKRTAMVGVVLQASAHRESCAPESIRILASRDAVAP